MSEKPFVTIADWNDHIRSDPKLAHGIYTKVRDALPAFTYSRSEIDAFFEGEALGKKQVDWARITSKPSTYPPSSHTHDDRYFTKSQINTYLEAQDALSELDEVFITSPAEGHILQYNASQAEWQNAVNPYSTLAGLTDTNIGAPEGGELLQYFSSDSKWHNVSGLPPSSHSESHELGGSDEVNHDSLVGFVAAEHVSLPNIIANVLTDHTKAIHDALDIDARYIDGKEVVAAIPTDGHVLTYVSANTRWEDKPTGIPAAHASSHESGGSDQLHHDDLDGYLASEHVALPNVIANVLSDHTKAIHDALNINAGQVDGIDLPGACATVLSDHNKATHDALDIDARYIDGVEVVAMTPTNEYVLTYVSALTRWEAKPTGTPGAHSASHETGGGDEVHHDSLDGYLASEHVSLPNSMANVINSGHTKALHDALALDHGSLSGLADDDHSQYYNAARHTKAIHDALDISAAYIDGVLITAATPSGGDILTYDSEFSDWRAKAPAVHSHAHDDLTGVTDDQHHSKIHAVSHKSAGGDAIRVDELKVATDNTNLDATTTYHGLLPKLYGGSVRFLRADGTWAITPGGTPDAHADSHEVGGSDLVGHDLLTGFVAAEHLSLPNTIANVLSDHNLATHNALSITTLGTIVTGVWQGTAIGWTYISKTGSNLTDLATRQHAGLTDVTSDQHHTEDHTLASHTTRPHSALSDAPADAHHPQSHTLTSHSTRAHSELTGIGVNDHHAQAHTLASHSTKAHSELTGITSGQHHAQLHEASHRSGAGDALNHDLLAGFVAAEHKSLPNTIAEVLSNHTKAVHDALGIEAANTEAIDGVAVVAATPANNEVLTYVQANTRWEAKTVPMGALNDLSDVIISAVESGDLLEYSNVDSKWHNVTDPPPASHSHVKADITDTPWAWSDVSKTGSNLTDLVTRQHAGLTNITSDQHHPQSHTLASHSTKPHSALTDVTANQHHAQSHTLASHSTKAHSELTDIGVNDHHTQSHTLVSHTARDHHNLTGLGDDDHSIYYNAARHTKAIHDALDIDARYIDGKEVVAATPTDGYVLMYVQANTRWEDKPIGASVALADLTDVNIGAPENGEFLQYFDSDNKWHNVAELPPSTHASTHHVGGNDLVNHDSLTGFVPGEHKSLPNTIAQVLSNHTKAVHDALGILHSSLGGVSVNQHHLQLHGSSHHLGGGDAVKLDNLASPDDNVDLNASITKHGLLKKLGGGTTNFLRADGIWATPSGQTFLGLTDTPGSYSGQGGKNVRVNVGETALDFVDPGAPAPHASTHEVGGGDSIDGILSLEKLGVGIANPAAKAHIYHLHNVRNTVVRPLIVETTYPGYSPYSGFGTGILFQGIDYSNYPEPFGAIEAVMEGHGAGGPPDPNFKAGLRFYTVPIQASGLVEKMRLDASGNLTLFSATSKITGGTALYLEAGANGVRSATIQADTTVYAATLRQEGGANSIIMRSTSGRKYKDKINNIELDTSLLHKLKPRSFNSKSKHDGNGRFVGLIADEVGEIFPDIVEYNEDGEAENYDDKMLMTLILAETQRHEARIKALEDQLNKSNN